MRDIFPAYFRPEKEELSELWKNAYFAVDANVLLNLYRYSTTTRAVLEEALTSIREQLFLPHQVALEFLKNRLRVISGQSREYTNAGESLNNLLSKLSDKKRHPFISDESLKEFQDHVEKLKKELAEKRDELLNRLTSDERLKYIETTFSNRTGQPYTDDQLSSIAEEGEARFAKRMPPGYMDANKSNDDDEHRKYGDLILWKQLIDHAKNSGNPVILISDDGKEDWWLEHSGRTIGPRTELREEFLKEAGQDFWMYSVDSFLEHSAEIRHKPVNEEAIAEVQEVRTEILNQSTNAFKSPQNRSFPQFRSITDEEMLRRIRSSEKWAADHEGFISVHSFIHNYLRGGDFDFESCYGAIESLERKGLIEVYEHQGEGHARPVRAVRTVGVSRPFGSHPLSSLRDLLNKAHNDADG